ncbi:GNAT family N-acetyltransferase [Paenibacillus nasutitermitis]|uniref:N-acetyltransferase domain-containing protein n=1 Tax=Paenibacillus nasutitermitis TaxID=1652958 RepID=A0A916Z440_9BACL|nr:GNAT family N-acetyltransferase [Paenibacillus nasutitermitis]GGD75271.1 hypothetical protein GCM10010911_36500 [Paenibacillus nasutitermitis]
MEEQPQLVMFNPSLAGLPEVQLASDYTVRSFQPGDEAAWETIINEAFGVEYRFAMMADDDEYRPERIFFICWEGKPVATASAWWRKQWGDETGYLHMVGALAAHAGRKLGYMVSLAAMHRMAEEKRVSAILNTDDSRLAAIVSYLKLGYEPEIADPGQIERWKLIFGQINDQERLKRL